MSTLVNPLDERSAGQQSPAPRLDSLEGKTLALLDISKPRGSELLGRLGRPDLEAVFVSHPIQDRTPAEIEERADAVIEEVVSRLTGDP